MALSLRSDPGVGVSALLSLAVLTYFFLFYLCVCVSACCVQAGTPEQKRLLFTGRSSIGRTLDLPHQSTEGCIWRKTSILFTELQQKRE